MSESTTTSGHTPVFLRAILEIFRAGTSRVAWMFDGTFGRGGHSSAMMAEWPSAREIAFDWDEEAIAFGHEKFASQIESGQLRLVRANFQDFAEERAKFSDVRFDRMLLDLGVSSPQLDQAHRGFSFYHDGPLDMRMDRRLELTAAEIVNTWDEQDLARLFIEYGEVQKPFRVVRAIVHDRSAKKPWETTKELASLIERVDGWQKKGSHPATRYFMALRLKVNEELEGLSKALPALIDALNDGGLLAVITFHSLEDRIVKHIFKEHLDKGRLVNKKVIKPDDEEIRLNPRARSAKLRAFEKGPAT
jgi:16S rRNA (cytosine1402-N4)-methyltransferase